MPKVKIIQIAVNESVLYGLDFEGNVYYWGSEKVSEELDKDGETKFINGWKLMEDKINKIKT